MTQIVINGCFGGFSLSDVGMRRYAEIKGLTLYPEKESYGTIIYYLVTKEQRTAELPGFWDDHPLEVRKAHNEAVSKESIYSRDIARDDPALVQVVNELKTQANGVHASLRVVEVPDEVTWQIEEYDGSEHVAEVHRTWS